MTPNLLFLPGLLEDADGFKPVIDGLSSRVTCSVADLTRSDTIAGMARDALAQAPERFSLAGRQDQILPVEVLMELADGIPGARLTVIEDCGHMAAIEQPARVLAAFVEWLDRRTT